MYSFVVVFPALPVTAFPGENYTHRNPHFLPDGERFLFTERDLRAASVGRIAVGSIDGGAHSTILEQGSNPQWADGYVFFVRDRNLVAQRFDPQGLGPQGPQEGVRIECAGLLLAVKALSAIGAFIVICRAI